MKLFILLTAIVFSAGAASPIVRPAPDFTFDGIAGKKNLRSLRGQPVVLVIARSPRARDFRKQLDRIGTIYNEFASRGVVFICAFTEADGQVPSDIPFVTAASGASVAQSYSQGRDFSIAIIGRDGNLDLNTDKVLPAFRIREVIQNSFQVQNDVRKQQPKGPPQ